MDVIIIGAGAAGLAAAAKLARQKRSVLVLEARDRIGGRCWSRQEPGLAVPIELGAEFIHGMPAVTFELLRKVGISAVQRTGTRWFVKLGGLRPRDRGEFLDRIRRAMEEGGMPRKDVPFADYLDSHLKRRLSPDERTFALRMVEGYDAADPARVSAREIVEEWTGEGAASDASFRPLGGYSAMLGSLAGELNAAGAADAHLRLQSVVQTVRWKRGQVEVSGTFLGKAFRETAHRALVTLPLGVLQLPSGTPGTVEFTPPLKEKMRALAGLSSGPVLKVLLRFSTPFWEELEGGRYQEAGFFQAPEAPFPTFWTALPVRAPLLVAWAGGPRASRMAGMEASGIVRHALSSLKTVFKGVGFEPQLEAAYVHDWQRDPYARGAYAWVKAGAARARKALAASLEDTLYFAGEAADFRGEAGTVAGALQSGVRAAREILSAESGARRPPKRARR